MSEATASPKRAAKRARGSARLLIGVAALAFVALAVWLANQVPPNITHPEAMTIAAAVENATSQAQLQAMLHPSAPRLAQPQVDRTPGGLRSDPAEAIWVRKGFASCVFIRRRDSGTGRAFLLFRFEKDDVVYDYQELRVERHDEQPRIVDVWSMAAGGWLGELHAEHARLENGYPQAAVDALVESIRSHEPPDRIAAAFGAIAEPFRSSKRLGVQFLHSLDRRDVPALRRGIAEYQALHRHDLTADLVVLQAAQLELKQKGKADADLLVDARNAVPRIEARTEDKAFLEAWLGQLH